MNIKQRPALFFVITALTVIVCRCGGAMGALIEPIRLAEDGAIIGSCEYFSDFSDSTEVDGTAVVVTKDLWDCSVTCPDNTTVNFELRTKPPAVIAVAEKEAFLAQYCSAEAMIAAPAASETPTEEPTATVDAATATSTVTAVPTEQVIIIPPQNIFISQPILAGSVSACDTGLGFINFPLADPIPDLTGKNLEVIFNGYLVNCAVAGSRGQVLGCSLPTDTTFPLQVGTTLDGVQVDVFSFSGATCIKTPPTQEKEAGSPADPAAPTAPPIDCDLDPYNPAC